MYVCLQNVKGTRKSAGEREWSLSWGAGHRAHIFRPQNINGFWKILRGKHSSIKAGYTWWLAEKHDGIPNYSSVWQNGQISSNKKSTWDLPFILKKRSIGRLRVRNITIEQKVCVMCNSILLSPFRVMTLPPHWEICLFWVK